jgi:ornithine cyclodeaminase/alanine dehydrogenase-like protein (mu-crystallin family)
MIILTNEDVEKLLDMTECVSALEQAYYDLGKNEAADIPRQDMLVSNSRPNAIHAFKTMSGSWPRRSVCALRLNSDIVEWPVVNNQRRRFKVPLSSPGGRYNGGVLLFSTETGQLLCMFNDGVVQKTRVGATSGLGAKYLARKNARVLGLIGTGWQAEAQIEAMCAVRDFALVKVFSPTVENKNRFVERYRKKLNVNIVTVDSDEEAADGVDVLVSATNSMNATIQAKWLKPGMHVTVVRGSELSTEVLTKVDRLVVNTKELVTVYPTRGWPSENPEFEHGDYSRSDTEVIDYARVPEMQEIVAGHVPGRQSEEEITCYYNFKGLGLQFAALGSIIYTKALEQGLGLKIDDSYFTQNVHP